VGKNREKGGRRRKEEDRREEEGALEYLFFNSENKLEKNITRVSKNN
jgi:hypothetical protein